MPGHKFNENFYIEDLFSYDYTEIDGTDNLFNPTEAIYEAQHKASALFGADNSFFMVNGSSGGLIAALLSAVAPRDKIIVARNCHRSVYNGLVLSGAIPIYIYPDVTDYGIAGGISPEALTTLLEQHKSDVSLKAVVITSPTYEGFCSDIKRIADTVHAFGKLLIVDEAHGSHFIFHNDFPDTALESGADIVVQSWHKTLPVLTQCSVLHTKGGRVNLNRLRQMLQTIQTSSPSYIFMCSMDKCRETLEEQGEVLFSNYVDELKSLRSELMRQSTIELLGGLKAKHSIADIDISKLVFYINSDISGKALAKMLFNRCNLVMECAGINTLIAMTAAADTRYGFELIKNGIIETSRTLEFIKTKPSVNPFVKATTVMPPHDAVYGRTEKIRLADSIGKICGEWVVPYPPGIPLILPGELITEEVVEAIRTLIGASIQLSGGTNGAMEYIDCLQFGNSL